MLYCFLVLLERLRQMICLLPHTCASFQFFTNFNFMPRVIYFLLEFTFRDDNRLPHSLGIYVMPLKCN